ncbi:MAG: DPP IV N-terminal domain-containing protein, partial [Candidatus Marinimicrobia bacterium]|nr:DPP IV N-terminal domain-containing protein [Candidatus Neomarinimicrobiota bacterium]
MTLHRVILIALVVGVFSTVAKSQEEITSLITLDRIYKTKEFTPKKFVTTEWHERGKGYTTLESSETLVDVKDLVRYDLETGERKILVGAESLIPNGRSLPLQIDNYSWSPDGGKLLIFTNSKRVWRTNTRGDYWTFDLSNQKLTQLGGDAMRSTLMFATFSPDGSMIGYVRENNIYVEDVKSGKIKRLTSDGSKTIINGTFDWVYEEEFGLQNGFRWSPDSKLIAYWQLDASGVGEFNMINTTDSVYSKIIPLQYPKVGTTNSSAKVGVVKAKGGKTKWMKVSGDPRNNYIARMEWAANSEEIIIQRLNRNQNENQLMLGNAKSGNVRTILTEIDEAWLDVVEDWVWTEDGGSLTWVSERDGWRHVYLVSRDGKKVDLITPGEFDVINILNIDTKNGWLYYIASPDNPTQRYLYRSPLKGGNPERLTPEGQGGYHS